MYGNITFEDEDINCLQFTIYRVSREERTKMHGALKNNKKTIVVIRFSLVFKL